VLASQESQDQLLTLTRQLVASQTPLGQRDAYGSLPVVLASDQPPLQVTIATGQTVPVQGQVQLAGALTAIPVTFAPETRVLVSDATLAPAQGQLVLTPSDTADVSALTSKGLVVDVAGRVRTQDKYGNIVDRTTVPANTYLCWNVARLLTGTTARVIGMW
jgi:hypothetical protein